MSLRNGRRALIAISACVLALPVHAQEGDEHSVHHEGEAAPSAMATPSATNSGGGSAANGQPAVNGGMSSMSSMMQDMMGGEGEHGGRDRRGPFFTRLLAYPTLSSAERQALANKANQRITDGLALINAGNAAAMHAPTPQARLDAASQLREGLDLLKGGAGGA